jgi:hypothetical protein
MPLSSRAQSTYAPRRHKGTLGTTTPYQKRISLGIFNNVNHVRDKRPSLYGHDPASPVSWYNSQSMAKLTNPVERCKSCLVLVKIRQEWNAQ